MLAAVVAAHAPDVDEDYAADIHRLLGEVERLCDHVAIVHHGRVVAAGSLTDLLGQPAVRLQVSDLPADRSALAAFGPSVLAAGADLIPLSLAALADRHVEALLLSAAEAGPWRTDRNPLLREPMDALSDHHPASQVSCMFCSQFGKSEILNNWVGYTIDHSPGPMLLIEPTVEVMERYSKQRIEPMIAAAPTLRSRSRQVALP